MSKKNKEHIFHKFNVPMAHIVSCYNNMRLLSVMIESHNFKIAKHIAKLLTNHLKHNGKFCKYRYDTIADYDLLYRELGLNKRIHKSRDVLDFTNELNNVIDTKFYFLYEENYQSIINRTNYRYKFYDYDIYTEIHEECVILGTPWFRIDVPHEVYFSIDTSSLTRIFNASIVKREKTIQDAIQAFNEFAINKFITE